MAVMRKFALTALLAAAMSALAAEAPDLDRVEKLVLERTNQFRREQGLEAVKADRTLAKAADEFAAYMARTDEYGHEADGRTPARRAAAHGYDYCLVSENISYQYTSHEFRTTELATRYVEGWKDSPGHRRNMLEPAATDTAVAVAQSAKTRRYYAVQLFGRPRAASIEYRITNAARETVRYRISEQEFTLAPGSTRIHTQCGFDEVGVQAERGKWTTLRPIHGDKLVIARTAGGRLALRSDR